MVRVDLPGLDGERRSPRGCSWAGWAQWWWEPGRRKGARLLRGLGAGGWRRGLRESSRPAQPGRCSFSRKEGSYGFPPLRSGKDGTRCGGAMCTGRMGEAGRALPHPRAESGPVPTPLPTGQWESQTCFRRVGRLRPYSHIAWTPFLLGGFPPGVSDSKESACSAGDPGSIPGLGRCPGGGHDNPLQYSCLENLMDRGVWRATVHGVAKSQTWLSSNFQSSSVPFLLCVWEEWPRPQSCWPLLFSGHGMQPSQLEDTPL